MSDEQERMMVIASNAAALSATYGPDHPSVRALHEALATLAAESVRRRDHRYAPDAEEGRRP